MARDAIARQYDVEKNTMTLTCEGEKGGYRPGTITFDAKKGKSIDLDKIRESITATRLSGGTNMRVEWLEITVTGEVEAASTVSVLKSAGTGQQFLLGEEPSAKGKLERLREVMAKGGKVTSVSGRVPGWTGRFPDVLKALTKTASESRSQLLVTGFEVAK